MASFVPNPSSGLARPSDTRLAHYESDQKSIKIYRTQIFQWSGYGTAAHSFKKNPKYFGSYVYQ